MVLKALALVALLAVHRLERPRDSGEAPCGATVTSDGYRELLSHQGGQRQRQRVTTGEPKSFHG